MYINNITFFFAFVRNGQRKSLQRFKIIKLIKKSCRLIIMSYFIKTNVRGDYNIGLYGFATDSYCFTGFHDKKPSRNIKKILKVKIISNTVLGTEFASIFCAGNSKGIVVPGILEDFELDDLKKKFDVLVINTEHTALGNLIIMNDSGIIISPLLRKFRNEIKDFFNIPFVEMKLFGSSVIGKLAIATNRGCLLYPSAKKKEIEKIQNVLGVKAYIGTVNYGSSFVGSGIIANRNGFVAGTATSGPELGRITEALGFL